MKFPGRRKSKHYFPVQADARESFEFEVVNDDRVYIVGIDQLIVDVEIKIDDHFLAKYGLVKGESTVLEDQLAEDMFHEAEELNRVVGIYPGGAIGNTLHNYSVISDNRSVSLGAISKHIGVGDYAFNYISKTTYHVDFSYLYPADGPMGRAMCFITPDGERTFAIAKGIMNKLPPHYIPEDVISGATALLISAFLLRDENSPMFQSVIKAVEIAKKNEVPVVMSMGTSSLVRDRHEFFVNFIKNYVQVLAMNEKEAQALVGIEDPLLAGQKVLDLTDLALITVGEKGLYLCSHCEEENLRETKDQIHSKSIPEYNRYEYSRSMMKIDCKKPVKIYTHINPYLGGPKVVTNTNGAGDAALAALLHDMSANLYHKTLVPSSPKHHQRYLTYSSLHQISKYANRVSFEVLIQNSPRLSRGLPEREDNLDEAYWAK